MAMVIRDYDKRVSLSLVFVYIYDVFSFIDALTRISTMNLESISKLRIRICVSTTYKHVEQNYKDKDTQHLNHFTGLRPNT
jgi:hypothetical protein